MKKLLFISVLSLSIALLMTNPAFAYLIRGLEGEIDAVDVKIDGRHYILLIDVCTANGIEWEWDSVSGKIALRKNGREVIFLVGSKYYYAGEEIKKMPEPAVMKNGSIYMPLQFAKYTIKRLFEVEEKSRVSGTEAIPKREAIEAERPSEKKYRIKKVVIDPGHGGKDPGAISRTGLREKDIVLDVSRKIKMELEENGIEVIMTRDSDRFIPLSERTRIASRNDADLFVSIHANANRARWLRGFEVYYLSEATDDNARALATAENSVLKYEEDSFAKHTKDLDAIVWDLTFTENREESIELAGFICQEVGRVVRPQENGVKRARFYVLKGAEMPAVLVELSYISNRLDEKNLRDSYYREDLAKGVAAGIIGYKCEYERANGFSR
jgi:N-acetylmuramoyl-L-alanine amidase